MTRFRLWLMACIDALRRLWWRMFGVRTHTLHTSQGRLRYLEAKGSGLLPPVLLIHGLSSCGVDWEWVIRKLRRRCKRVRAVDLPGHGWSDEPKDGMGEVAMRKMLSEASEGLLDIPQVVVGNSLGGLVAVRAAGTLPDRVLGLVLVSPAGASIPQADLETLMARFDIDSWTKAREFVEHCMGGRTWLHMGLTWGIRARLAHPSVRALVDAFSHENLLTADELSSLTMPILLYWGQDDEILDGPHIDFYRTHLPAHAEFITPEHMGHAPFMDSVAGFVDPVLDFCARLPSPTGCDGAG
jgi:pimeloyl-ACP methyl ester carboxylesterase